MLTITIPVEVAHHVLALADLAEDTTGLEDMARDAVRHAIHAANFAAEVVKAS